MEYRQIRSVLQDRVLAITRCPWTSASPRARRASASCSARRGLCPEAASSWFLPRLVGISQTLEWTLSGRVFGAQEALQGRLVRSLHAPAELLPAAFALAREIADQTSAVSVALTRALLWRMLGAAHPMEAHRIDSRGIRALGQSADAREGVGAFLEKRAPRFSARPSRDMPDFYPWWAEPEFE